MTLRNRIGDPGLRADKKERARLGIPDGSLGIPDGSLGIPDEIWVRHQCVIQQNIRLKQRVKDTIN